MTATEFDTVFNNVTEALEDTRMQTKDRQSVVALIDKENHEREISGLPALTEKERRSIIMSQAPSAQDIQNQAAKSLADRLAQRVKDEEERGKGLQFPVTYACGWDDEDGVHHPHTGHIILKPEEAKFPTIVARRVAEKATQVCPICWKNRFLILTDKFEEDCQPEPLIGSVAQIQFGRDTRRQAIERFRKLAADICDGDTEMYEIFQAYESRALAWHEARVWCDVNKLLPSNTNSRDQTLLAVVTVADEYAAANDLSPLLPIYN